MEYRLGCSCLSLLRGDNRFSIEYVSCLYRAIKADLRFDSLTRHTTFTARNGTRLDVAFLRSPETFKSPFSTSTPVVVRGFGVNVLDLATVLDSECATIVQRSGDSRQITDGQYIVFVLRRAARQGRRFFATPGTEYD